MADFVLVHGAWHGGWCWRDVTERLRALGHRVAAPTLTGLGDRSHLLAPGLNMDTHIQDVVSTARWEGFDRFVLCGHSYGGAVITGAAERLEPSLDGIVYIDAVIPEDGQSAATAMGFDPPAGEFMPPPSAVQFVIDDLEARRWVDQLMTPHPISTVTQPLRLTGAHQRVHRKTYALAGRFPSPHFRANYERLRQDPAWETHEYDAGHHLMIDEAQAMVQLLVRAAGEGAG